MAVAAEVLAKEFLDTLPLPDNVGAGEYRVIHEALEEFDLVDLDDVEATLREFSEWADDLRKRVRQFRRRHR